MKIVVSCNGMNKPHKDAILKTVGYGHKEWLLDVSSHDAREGRKATASYDSYLQKYRLHFFDDGIKEAK